MDIDIQARADALQAKLDKEISYEASRAKGDYWAAMILMMTTLGSSVLAGLGGLGLGWTASETAIVAFVPGAITIIATTMKFEGKSNWHYRKLYALDELKSRLLFELPRSPTVDDIAAISQARRELIKEMNEVWEKSLSFSWSQFKSSRPTRPSSDD